METRAFRFQVLIILVLIVATLWSSPPLQAATNIKLSGVMPALGDVNFFQISPDGRYAVYLADQTTDGVNGFIASCWEGDPYSLESPSSPR